MGPNGLKKYERVAASELLMVNSAVANLVMQGKSAQIGSVMETGQGSGMQTLEQDLARLWVSGRIGEAAALAGSRHPAGVRDRAALLRKNRTRIGGAPYSQQPSSMLQPMTEGAR